MTAVATDGTRYATIKESGDRLTEALHREGVTVTVDSIGTPVLPEMLYSIAMLGLVLGGGIFLLRRVTRRGRSAR